jgi:hypothetical protein
MLSSDASPARPRASAKRDESLSCLPSYNVSATLSRTGCRV